jgi:hypothetical protein
MCGRKLSALVSNCSELFLLGIEKLISVIVYVQIFYLLYFIVPVFVINVCLQQVCFKMFYVLKL